MIPLTFAFLVGMVCGSALTVTIFVTAVVKMHKVEQNARYDAPKITPVILHDSGVN